MAESPNKSLPPVETTVPGSDINMPTGRIGLIVVCKTASVVRFYDQHRFAVLDEIALPAFPHEVVLSPDQATAYVSIYGNGQVGTNTKPGTQIAVIDVGQRKLKGYIELAPYCSPHALSFDRAGRLWSTAELSNAIIVIDPARGVVLDSVALGSHRTHFMAVTADGKKIYAPHRQLKFVSVVDVETRKEIKRIDSFSYECQGVAVSPDNNRVYQASSARPLVTIIDPRTDTVAGAVTVEGLGDFPPQLARLKVSPDNRWLVVSYHVAKKAAVLDTRDLARQFLFDLEKAPMGIAFPDKTRAFVTNHNSGSVTIIDLDQMKTLGRFETPMGAESLAFY